MSQMYPFHNSIKDLYAVMPSSDIANTLSKFGLKHNSSIVFHSTLYGAFSLKVDKRGVLLHVKIPYGHNVDDFFHSVGSRGNRLSNTVDIPPSMVQVLKI